MTVIHLSDRRPSDQPSQAHTSQDQFGRPMFEFVIEYPHLAAQSGQPRMWTASIWAYDEADADARIRALRDHGAIVGQLVEDGVW